MTREQHLEFCKRCKNRAFDAQQGIVCSLTKRIADFEGTCLDFNLDESVRIEKQEQEPIQNYEVVRNLAENSKEKLRLQQDIVYAIIGGLSAAIVGSLLWAVITVSAQYQIGYMAIGVGLLAGFAVRYFGLGVDQHFGFIGAFFALLGCAMGNLFSQVGFMAQAQSLGYFEALTLLNIPLIISIYQDSFSPVDILFYGIAAYEGYKFAFRSISEQDINLLAEGKIQSPSFNRFRLPIVCALFAALVFGFFYISKGVSDPKTFYYDSGAKQSMGQLSGGLEEGPWSYWWENGNLLYKGYFTNGKQDSLWEYYDENGVLSRRCAFKSGLLHGQCNDYYENGTVSATGQYAYGRQHGLWNFFHEDGNISQKGYYILDKPDSTWEYFYSNGEISAKGSFKVGQMMGRWEYWNDQKRKTQELEYQDDGTLHILNTWHDSGLQQVKNGDGVYKAYHYTGKMAETGTVKNGLKSGTWKFFYENGNIREEGQYVNTDYKVMRVWSPEGEVLVKDGNGTYQGYHVDLKTIIETGQILDGYRSGIWKSNALSGALLSEITYRQGKANGLAKWYFESGSINVEGAMSDDKRDGAWKWYFENGSVESDATFKKDKKEGLHVFYNDVGEVIKTEVYQNGDLIRTDLNSQ